MNSENKIIKFNISGKIFPISLLLLKKYPQSLLYKIAIGQINILNDESGYHFIDSNEKNIKYILDFYKYDINCIDIIGNKSELIESIKLDLKFFQLPDFFETYFDKKYFSEEIKLEDILKYEIECNLFFSKNDKIYRHVNILFNFYNKYFYKLKYTFLNIETTNNYLKCTYCNDYVKFGTCLIIKYNNNNIYESHYVNENTLNQENSKENFLEINKYLKLNKDIDIYLIAQNLLKILQKKLLQMAYLNCDINDKYINFLIKKIEKSHI